MVTDQRGRSKRRIARVLVIFIVALVALGFAFFVLSPKLPRGRAGIVLQGDPTIVVSWESDRARFAVFLLPSSLQIEAVNGYGWYSLDALWKLDAMDRHKGGLYRTSLEESFATPIRWHGALPSTATSFSDDMVIVVLKHTFSLSNIIRMVVTGNTNIRLGEMLYVWKKFQLVGSDTATVFDFRNNQITYDEQMPDQTLAIRFDKERYDAIIGNNLEDTPLRQEGIRIALYNTTGTPGIGQRVARLIEHTGGFVVSVGNDDVPYEGVCEVSAMKPFLTSYTADFLRSMYGCTLVERQEVARADLVVRLGKGIERRYLPK
ncbi:MAG: LytR C-terminal domain-containing protein [Candidatus Gottesmanbacteria bacterium]